MIQFLINLYRDNLSYLLALKQSIEQMLELDYFRTIAKATSIIAAICLLPKIPRMINAIIRKFKRWDF